MNDKPEGPNDDNNKLNKYKSSITKYTPFASPNTLDNNIINNNDNKIREEDTLLQNNKKRQLQAISYNPLYSSIFPEYNIELTEFFIPSMGFCMYDFTCLSSKMTS